MRSDGDRWSTRNHGGQAGDKHRRFMATSRRRAPLREEPAPSEERHRSCACSYERAPSSGRRSHVLKSPGGLLVPGEPGGTGTLVRRRRQIGVADRENPRVATVPTDGNTRKGKANPSADALPLPEDHARVAQVGAAREGSGWRQHGINKSCRGERMRLQSTLSGRTSRWTPVVTGWTSRLSPLMPRPRLGSVCVVEQPTVLERDPDVSGRCPPNTSRLRCDGGRSELPGPRDPIPVPDAPLGVVVIGAHHPEVAGTTSPDAVTVTIALNVIDV